LDEIFQKARRGDKSAEEELFRYLRVRFALLAKRRLGKEHAEDIAHDACLTVLEKYQSLSETTDFLAWAYKVLRNKIGNFLRVNQSRKKGQNPSDKTGIDPQSIAIEVDSDLKGQLIICLKRFAEIHPEHARALDLLLKGYPIEEITRELDISSNNLYVMLHRGRKWLHDCMFSEKGKS